MTGRDYFDRDLPSAGPNSDTLPAPTIVRALGAIGGLVFVVVMGWLWFRATGGGS